MSDSLKISRRKLSDEVFDRLYQQLLEGAYAPGDSLPSERELMESFGVGRPAIREAVQALERLGLVAIHHGQRPKVLTPSADGMLAQIELTAMHLLATEPATLDHLKEARKFFEVGMVARAARKLAPKDLARLEALVAQQRRALNRDIKAFITADMDFHVAIAESTGNPIFVAVSRAMFEWLARFHTSLIHWKGSEHVTLEEHERILAALKKADEGAAIREMQAHLERARSVYAPS
ncbi:transcriptional regulator NanR [Halomonas denitrificans]|uniref:transcriptional regulator NanR n=1 Tax=Halomonas denitrificans TaxID=370769 RepID=UPI001C99A9B3|nr:transcriptional regulator NanR [Halomonas denitrificans]MBY5968640.1 transcriptional regulator NanR [Halomonas denitrificans]